MWFIGGSQRVYCPGAAALPPFTAAGAGSAADIGAIHTELQNSADFTCKRVCWKHYSGITQQDGSGVG